MENSKIKGLKPLVETDFVSLYDVEYKNKKGQEKHWMVSSRKSKEELEKVYLENNEDKIDAVVICALHKAQNKLVLINQYRVPINKYIYELPAGLVDNNEDIETSVRRELKEETGYEATEDQLTKLFDVHVALGYSSEVITIFYVDGLEYAGEQNPDEDEFINLKKYKVEDALKLLDDNTITDSKTMLALMYLKIRKGTK